MKINRIPEHNISFNGYYTPQAVKNLENFIMNAAGQNSHLSNKDIQVMRQSILSFNAFYNGTKTLNPERISNELYNKFQIPSNFKGDKILAGASALAANIFHKLKLPQPKGLYKDSLAEGVLGECNILTRIIRFTDRFNWAEVQNEAVESKVYNHSSTGHFLKTFLHEFMHNYHINKLDRIIQESSRNPVYASIVNSNAFIQIRQLSKLDTKIFRQNGAEIRHPIVKNYIQNKLSKYGATLPAEMFAETGAKLIADSLDMRTLRPTHHPFAFKDFTQDKFLMSMMDDFYNGKFDKYL